MDNHPLHPVRTATTYLLALGLSACASASPATAPAPSAAAAQPTATLAVAATPAFTSTPEQPASENILQGPDVRFEHVHLRLPGELGKTVDAHTVPAEDRLGEVYPAHSTFLFPEYTSGNTGGITARIEVYPVAELGLTGTQIVQQMRDLLREQPAAIQGSLPVLPPVPAGQLVTAQPKYLTFASGTGIRVLTEFAQASWPVSNEGLVYVFQGLTNDDGYYISAVLPVSAPFLAERVVDPAKVPEVDGVAYPQFNSPNYEAEYASYQEAITRRLNATSPQEFSPALDVLDALIASLEIEPVATPADPTAQACVDALPTRLQVGLFAYVDPDPPLPNNLRREAGKEQEQIGEIQPGQAMKILEGPRCADGWVWWRVRTFEPEMAGWTAEGGEEEYWLIPCASRNECKP